MRSIITLMLLMVAAFHTQGQEKKSVVIVELFTSEGCSSCPPADRLLSNIVNNDNEHIDVLGLSFHVDYWDYIGWKDPYAEKLYTVRQRAYARRFGLNSIYTPQMIVNGKHEFVGSSRSELNKALVLEAKATSKEGFEVSILSKTKTSIAFSVKSNNTANSQINVAIIEKNLSQDVKRGENRGRTLTHDNVVRAFDTRSFDGKENKFQLSLPEDLVIANASLIIYAQASSTWYVNSATQIKLSDLSQ
ncbi:MAG: DUF1223 domain-containing protein [Ekhidna sp.]